MGKQAIVIQVKENKATLKKHLANCKNLKQEKRIRMLLYFKNTEAPVPDGPLYKELNISQRTLQRWKHQYSEEGVASFLSAQTRKKGFKQVSAQLHEAFKVKLNDTKDPLLGYWHAVEWAKADHGAEVQYQTLRQYLIKHFGTKIKRGRKSHIEKDQGAEQAFLKSYLNASGI